MLRILGYKAEWEAKLKKENAKLWLIMEQTDTDSRKVC